MKTCITIKAPAKINVTLEVVGRLASGFHEIRSVLVKLDKLSDLIDIQIDAFHANATPLVSGKNITSSPPIKKNIEVNARAAPIPNRPATAPISSGASALTARPEL